MGHLRGDLGCEEKAQSQETAEGLVGPWSEGKEERQGRAILLSSGEEAGPVPKV